MRSLLVLLTFLLNNSMIGAYAGAGTALHAGICVDAIVPVEFLNRLCRADFPAGSADHAIFSNNIGHWALSFLP